MLCDHLEGWDREGGRERDARGKRYGNICICITDSLCYKAEKTKQNTCTPMFIAALFTIARSWKQPKCPSTDEWIKKLWYIYTMEYYSTIKRNEIVQFAETWMDLETVIQSEVSQREKNKYRILTHICET